MSYCITESQDPSNLSKCKEIGEYVCAAYPGYTWHIRIDGGVLIIKNMSISGVVGMVRQYNQTISQDATAMKKDVVMAAGELLERASMSRRGRVSPETAKSLEGMPKGGKLVGPTIEVSDR